MFSDVWSENAALFERLMEIHSNPPILYYGFNFFRNNTVKPLYNEVLGTMKITLLYQVSHYIRVKKHIKSWDQQNYLVIRGFCYISDLDIMRFHCTVSLFETFMTISMMNTKSGTNRILPHRTKHGITLDFTQANDMI